MGGTPQVWHGRGVNVLAPVIAALLLGSPPPARSLPVHQLDERDAGTTITVEAGDRVIVRLRERSNAPWRAESRLALPLVVVGNPAGEAARGQRTFGYQLRGAGEADLAFVRGGATPARLRYRVVSR
jgi:hypothetical protein